jgi:hypothetical protein
MANNTQSSYINSLRQRHAELVENIRKLNEFERAMYQNLEAELGNTENSSVTQQQQIADKIADLKRIRTDLLGYLKSLHNEARTKLTNNKYTLADQMAFLQVIEEEIEQTKENIEKMNTEKNNTTRLVQIGNYEQKRYQAYIKVLKYVILFSVIAMVIYLGKERGIIPGGISGALYVVNALLAVYFVLGNVYDISRRDRFDFDKYYFPANIDEMEKLPVVDVVGKEAENASNSSLTSGIFGKCAEAAMNSAKSAVATTAGGLENTAASANDSNDLLQEQLSEQQSESEGFMSNIFTPSSSSCNETVRLEGPNTHAMVNPLDSSENMGYAQF